jgi:AcrR family transcriptional regulator
MKQRTPRSDGERTRIAILRTAASMATVQGLEGLSIGDLAAELGMSKSGLYAHFGSKEELQLATVAEAERVLTAEVVDPAMAADPGLGQLLAACEAFFSYLENGVFPGGCFFASAALEMGSRPGQVKDRVAGIQSDFSEMLSTFASTAIERGQLPADEDPRQLAFELYSTLLGADIQFVMDDAPEVLGRARTAVRRRLGTDRGSRS